MRKRVWDTQSGSGIVDLEEPEISGRPLARACAASWSLGGNKGERVNAGWCVLAQVGCQKWVGGRGLLVLYWVSLGPGQVVLPRFSGDKCPGLVLTALLRSKSSDVYTRRASLD